MEGAVLNEIGVYDGVEAGNDQILKSTSEMTHTDSSKRSYSCGDTCRCRSCRLVSGDGCET
jgi:hypothetical protein